MTVADTQRMDVDLAQLSDTLLDGVAELPAWETFLPILRRSALADCAFILLETRESLHAFPVVFASGAREEAIIDLYACGMRDPGNIAGGAIEDGAAAFQGRHGNLAYAGVSIGMAAGGRACLCLWWDGRDGPPEEALRLLSQLASKFTRAIRVFMRIVEVERRAAAFEIVADYADAGVILTARHGEVLICSKAARNMRARGDMACIRGGRLIISDTAAHKRLMSEIDRAIAGQSASNPFSSMAASLSSEPETFLAAMVYPGPRHVGARGPFRETAIVVLRDPKQRSPIPLEHVASLLHLTPAEAALATRLADGLSLTEIAATSGVKHNTLRCQLQSVYFKTGVKRQGDLIRLICSSVAALS